MKKLSFLMVLILLSMLFNVSCSNSKKTDGEKVVIEYWSIFPVGDPYSEKHDEIIREFQRQNPNIEIKHVGTSFWDYWQKIRTAQSGGADPEVSFGDITNVKFRAKSGILASLDSFMSKDGVKKDEYHPIDLEAMSYNNSLYALPFSCDSRLLYWNKAHFRAAGLDPEKPPKTLEEIEQYAEKLTIYEDESKKRLKQVGFHPRLGNNSIQQIVWPQGGSFFDEDGNPTVNKPENLKPLEWWVRMCKKYPVKAMNAFSSQANAAKISPFITGKLSMVIDGDWLAWDIQKNMPSLEYGVTSVPYADEKYRSTWSGGFTLELSARAKDKKAEAAWKLVKYLAGYEVQSKMIEYFSWVPANIKALEEIKKTTNEKQKFILEESKYRRHVDYCEAAPEWWIYVDPEITNAEAGKKDVKTALDDAQNALKTAIDNYNKINSK